MLYKVYKMLLAFKHSRHLKSISKFITIGADSILNSTFRVNVVKPLKDKIYISIGNDTMLDCTVVFESETGNIKIGNNVYIGNSNLICKNSIEIEDNVFIAWGVYLYDHNSHSLNYLDRQNDILQQLEDFRAGNLFIENKNWSVVDSKPIKICSNAWIGMNSLILKGVTVGEGAIVGAGSVVTKDVLPWTIVGGNPAVLIKEIPTELRKK